MRDTQSMFEGCDKLIEVDLSKFDSSKVSTMDRMFKDFVSLSYLNISNLITTQLTIVPHMFENCISFSSLDLSNFDMTRVTIIDSMFKGCSNLVFLNLSNVNAIDLDISDGMLSGYSKLSSLDLSSFGISGISQIFRMFYNCINLEYINLKKSTFKLDLSINNIFSSTSDNLMIRTNQNDERLINSVGSKKIVYCNNYVSIH